MSREQFEAWFEAEYKHLESSKYTDVVPHIKYGFFMAWQAATSAMEAKCAALAAENTAMKSALKFAEPWIPSSDEELNHRIETATQTPATNAFIAEQRAQGVEMLRDSIAEVESSIEDTIDLHHFCSDFAAQLRHGGAA